jgi:hypothetical protein
MDGSSSAANNGSSGLVARSASMKGRSMVRLLAAGWQLPHVRPLPSNASRKKMSAPAQIC